MDYLPYLYYIGRVKEYRILHSSFFTLHFPTPTQLYSISDIQRVSYCRGYLSGTARTSYTTMAISHLHDLSYLKSIDFKPQKDNQEQPLYI